MPSIQQIPNPISSKSYTPNSRLLDGNTEPFDLIDLSKVQRNAEPRENLQQESGTSSGKGAGGLELGLQLQLTKDPAVSARTLGGLLNADTLSRLTDTGNADLAESLNELSKALFLSPEGISGEIELQQKGQTLFQGALFDALRGLLSGSSDDALRAAIANVLKASSQLQSKGDILTAIGSNLKSMAGLLSLNKTLSDRLLLLAEQFSSPEAPEVFPLLKGQALELLKEAANSLLMSDKSQSLSSMVKYNLSRYNDNPYFLKDAMEALLAQIPNIEQRTQLVSAFNRYAVSLGYASSDAASQASSQSFPGIDGLAAFLERAMKSSSYLSGLEGAPEAVGNLLSRLEGGMSPIDVLRGMFSPLLTNAEGKALLPGLQNDLSKFTDLTELVNQLNAVLKAMPDNELRQTMYEGFTKIVDAMHREGSIYRENASGQSSIQALTDFLAKSMDDQALKSMGLVDTTALLQSLLTSPGALTPLAHYVLPANYEDTKAFGELWVDSEENGGTASSKEELGTHLFLVFDVDTLGRFELELYAKNQALTVSLLCPPALTGYYDTMRSAIGKIASDAGYTAKGTLVKPLTKARDLTEVFEKLLEKRGGLDVKI